MISLKLLYESPFASLISGWKKKKKRGVIRALHDPDLKNDPLKAEYVKSIPDAQLYKGVLFQGYLVPPDLLEGLEEMPIREDDVFIVTYPKSGTTWTEEIVSLIMKGGDVRKVERELLHSRVHHLEVGIPFGHLRFLKKLRSPRIMATHLPLPLLPEELRQSKCKIIYVMRNPKDTAVSYYHHHKMSTFLGNTSAPWDQFYAHFMAGHLVYGSWFDHVLPYWGFCKEHPNNVFFMAYEELKLDLHGMVVRLSEFLERPLTEQAIDDIVKHCSFESMKTNKMVNREVLPIKDVFDMTKTKFMRKGIIGDWKNYFTEEQSQAFDELCQSRMAHNDLQFVFEPDQALEMFLMHGRIIYNHPERNKEDDRKVLVEEAEEAEETKIETIYEPPTARYQPRYPFRWSWLPLHTLYLQPDPLTLDAVG